MSKKRPFAMFLVCTVTATFTAYLGDLFSPAIFYGLAIFYISELLSTKEG